MLVKVTIVFMSDLLSVEIVKQVSVPSADIEIRADGIMCVYIKLEDIFDVEHAKEVYEARTKLADGKKHPILYTFPRYLIPTPEARTYVASEERSELVLADAFVVEIPIQRIAARIYQIFHEPSRPSKVFNNKENGLKWLLDFVEG